MTLSKSNSKDSQRITLQRLNAFDGKGLQRTKLGTSPENPPLSRKLADSLRLDNPNGTRTDGLDITIDFTAQNDKEMIEFTQKMLERCLVELGINYGEKFVIDFHGPLGVKSYKAYLDRNYPLKKLAIAHFWCVVAERVGFPKISYELA